MNKFPSINQFRNAVNTVRLRATYTGCDEQDVPLYDDTKPIPTLKFRGTVKLHGTNVGVVVQRGQPIKFQSRTRELTVGNDNCQFAGLMSQSNLDWAVPHDDPDVVRTYFGEWCGKGIQKGVAINQHEKVFVLFAVLDCVNPGEEETCTWMSAEDMSDVTSEDPRFLNVNHFETFTTSINFNDPKLSVDELSHVTDSVERECPIAAALGHKGVGEGVVWTCVTPGWELSDVWFKTKGEKHKVSKTREKIPVAPERLAAIEDFTAAVVTEARLNQGIEALQMMKAPLDRKSTGKFLGWVVKDVLKEETDTIECSELEKGEVTATVQGAARKWFFNYLDDLTFGL